MTVNELILLDKAEVRRNSNLMHLYLTYFKEAFGKTPNCASCSFGTDWQKLVSLYSEKTVTLQKVNPMKTIKIKKIQGKILNYKKDGKTYRQYDNILTDEFINEFITNGTDEEIAERKKMFIFPVEEAKPELIKTDVDFVQEEIVGDLPEEERPNTTSTLKNFNSKEKRNRKNRK